MAADLRLVADAAEGDPDELPAEGPGDALAERGLADAGRADEHQHGAGPAAADDLQAAGGSPAADGQVLHDAVLHVVQPVMIGVENLARGGDVGVVLGRGLPRDLEHGVEPGADPARLRALVAGALQAADLAHRRLPDLVRQLRLLDAGAVVVRTVRLALAQLLANGRELLTQQELALRLLHAVPHVVPDLLGDVHLREVRSRPADEQLETRDQIWCLQDLALLLRGEVRRPAGGIGQHGWVRHLLHRVDDLPRVALLQGGDHQRLVLGREGARTLRDRLVVDQLGLHPEGGAGTGHAGADARAPAGSQHRGGGAAGHPPDLLDGGHDAVRGVAVGKPRRDQQFAERFAGAGGIARGRTVTGRNPRGVDGGLCGFVQLDRNDHAGEHDRVGEGQHRQGTGIGHESHPSKDPLGRIECI